MMGNQIKTTILLAMMTVFILMNLFSTHPPLADRITRLRGNRTAGRPRRKGFDRGQSEARNLWDRLSQ